MSTGSPNFDELRRLLALKRHERPPPPFFQSLAGEVMENLDAPERPETLSWLQRLGIRFDLSPALLAGLALLVGGLFAAGVALATRQTAVFPTKAPLPGPDGTPPPWEAAEGPAPLLASPPGLAGHLDEVPKSTAPVLQPDSSSLPHLRPQAAKAGFNTSTGSAAP